METYQLTNTPIDLNGIEFISFSGKSKDNIYQIDTYVDYEDYAGQYYVAEKDLANVLSPSLAEYIKQASQLTEPIGVFDSHCEDPMWEYGGHYVPVQKEFNIPKEYAESLKQIVNRNNMITPSRINDVDITQEQQTALKMGELIVVKGVSNGDEKKTLAVWFEKGYGYKQMEVPAAMENAPLDEIEQLSKVPTKINGVPLSDEQRMALKDGKAIDMPALNIPSKTVKVKMSYGQPIAVSTAKQAHKQEPAKPGRRMR